jgi:RNA polymerase primary sigma factor
MDASQIAECLRGLPPLQEKVVRLRYGLGCERAHSVKAIARAFAMTPEVIGGILMEAQRRLANSGLRPDHLRAAADDSRASGTLLARRERRCRNRLR